MEEEHIEPPSYIHIESNDFSYRRHKRQKEEDIAVCECQYDILDPESPCGERCLNVHTNTECTPGYCRCGVYCKNQAGQFVIEYCGEVISWKEAKRRSQAYETQGLKDTYIIYLNADESIDATRKGSLARFINHSCQPNCETIKWNVLGEVRVGIFAKQDIPYGTELSYDYNFEWFGGAMVRCLCGAASCSGFLGAKSRGFQEATYLWEDDDDRFSVENIPLYDSADDERTSISKDILLANNCPITQYGNNNTVHSTETPVTASTNEFAPMVVEQLIASSNELAPMTVEPLTASSNEFTPMTIEPLNAIPMGADFVENGSVEYSAEDARDAPQNSVQKVANNQNQTESQNNNHSELVPVRSSPKLPGRKAKRGPRKQLNITDICDRLASSVAREEILYCEEVKNQAASEIDALYDEIRPAIEEHERDSQDSVSTSLAEQWIEASCCKYKADFDLYAAIIKNLASTPLRSKDVTPSEQNGLKYLENGP
ncbi:histone-lysine N-methyltransferase ASHH1 isoform X2 [Phragmites australis]|uniref:histone-lysine N-methyltransferase ASHH1 isoform X2 n=1 Tax=Phragmites australis TaxID=29695 RepID=UPI002D783EC2|nr:histone-lysine N-methyltransferase ASHH1 isoform X2 [Phragmites australis]